MALASTIEQRSWLRLALARSINYDCNLRPKLKHNLQSEIYDPKPFIVQATDVYILSF